MGRKYWLFKSEPDAYSLEALRAEPRRTGMWDGIRNYQARNLLRDEVHKGDRVFFYHSNANPSAIVGVAEVTKEAYPDPTAFDPSEKYYDPKSDPDAPRWVAVDIKYVSTLPRPLPLPELRERPELAEMVLLNSSRLSIQPVTETEWHKLMALADQPAPERAAKRPTKKKATKKKAAATRDRKKRATRSTKTTTRKTKKSTNGSASRR